MVDEKCFTWTSVFQIHHPSLKWFRFLSSCSSFPTLTVGVNQHETQTLLMTLNFCDVCLNLGAVALLSSSYPLACGRAPCWRCAATLCWTPADAATRVPGSPERCDPRALGTWGPGGGSEWRRAPPAGRSRYCAESSSPEWRAAPRPSRRDTEANQSAGTSSPGTETDGERQEKTASIRLTQWVILLFCNQNFKNDNIFKRNAQCVSAPNLDQCR